MRTAEVWNISKSAHDQCDLCGRRLTASGGCHGDSVLTRARVLDTGPSTASGHGQAHQQRDQPRQNFPRQSPDSMQSD